MSDFDGPFRQGHYAELELNSRPDFAWLCQRRTAMGSNDFFVDRQGTFSAASQEFMSPPQPPYPYDIHEVQEPALFNSNGESERGVTVGSATVSKIHDSDEIDGNSFRGEDRDHAR